MNDANEFPAAGAIERTAPALSAALRKAFARHCCASAVTVE